MNTITALMSEAKNITNGISVADLTFQIRATQNVICGHIANSVHIIRVENSCLFLCLLNIIKKSSAMIQPA